MPVLIDPISVLAPNRILRQSLHRNTSLYSCQWRFHKKISLNQTNRPNHHRMMEVFVAYYTDIMQTYSLFLPKHAVNVQTLTPSCDPPKGILSINFTTSTRGFKLIAFDLSDWFQSIDGRSEGWGGQGRGAKKAVGGREETFRAYRSSGWILRQYNKQIYTPCRIFLSRNAIRQERKFGGKKKGKGGLSWLQREEKVGKGKGGGGRVLGTVKAKFERGSEFCSFLTAEQ